MKSYEAPSSKSNGTPSPENSSTQSSGSFALSEENENGPYQRQCYRSKSLTNIANYTPGEIRRIKERLLRTNSRVAASTIRNFNKKQKMALASLALVDFVSFCSMSIMAPFFPKEATEKGMSDTLSGFVFSFYALVMFVTSPIFGKILPKFGAKFLFLGGMFTAGVCNLLFGTLEYVQDYTAFTTLCITIRGFEALGASAFSTASYVFVVNTFPHNIGSVLGILETFVGLGMSIGPALGGILYSLGGFNMPFFILGIAMIAFVPINACLLPKIEECNVTNRSPSIWKLVKVPDVVITSLVVVIVSSTWAFLDPTLEPHLRQFNLTPEKIGLIFLLFSALYGISSPFWGWLADKVHNHWSMMVAGLFMCTVGLVCLGPCPYVDFLSNSLWLNLVALSVLGISVALALLPTFQGVLKSAVSSGGGDSLATYSLVAGVWSCMYSLGEVIGPSLGGFLLQRYGFPITSTIMASMTFSMGVIALIYFVVCSNCRNRDCSSDRDMGGSWRSTSSNTGELSETSPLLLSTTDDVGDSYRNYTEEKVQSYERRRKLDSKKGEIDKNQITDVRGTMSITAKGSCEV